MRPAAAPAGLGSPSSVGPPLPWPDALPPLPSCPSRFRRALLDPQAQAGPHWTLSESLYIFSRGAIAGFGNLSNGHGHLHLTSSSQGGDWVCLSPTLPGSEHK